MVAESLAAAEALASEGISAEVVNVSTIKPLDTATILSSVKKTGCAVSAEEHSIVGGLGAAVSEFLSGEHPVFMERVGVADTFTESGKPADLLQKYHMTAADIADAAKRAVEKKTGKK
ncbi:MAG TPA: transketolase, partial [Armatimonadetes bacterium]|nr:transketolase [Armatimonadota bacterium]